jgi:DNA-binding response OmpR family regulator
MPGSPIVLILEDEMMIAMMIEDELVDAGYDVAGPFATCSGAFSWLSTNTPDVAVLDTQLQDGSCRDVAVELRRRGIPFAVYSGATDTHMTELAGVPWVAKPALGKTLLDALTQAITLPEQAA